MTGSELPVQLRSREAAARKAAAHEAGEKHVVAVAPRLVELLRDRNAGVVATAAWALGQLRYAPAERHLIGLLAAPGIAVRQSAARALGRLASPGAVEALLHAVTDADESLVRAILAALNDVPAEKVVPRLVALLHHASGPVRARASRALLHYPAGAERAVRDALGALSQTAGDALGATSESTGDGAQPDDTPFRRAAAYVLGETATPAALAALLDLSRAEDPRTRLYAARGLARLAALQSAARTRLLQLRDDERRDVAGIARAALDAGNDAEDMIAGAQAVAMASATPPSTRLLPLVLPPGLTYLLTTLPGLEDVAIAETEEMTGARLLRRFVGAFLVALDAPPLVLENLRTVENALLYAGSFPVTTPSVPIALDDPPVTPDASDDPPVASDDQLRQAVAAITQVYPNLPLTLYVHVPRGTPVAQARDMRAVVATGLEPMGGRVTPVHASLTAEVVPLGSQALLGIRVLCRPPGHRPLPAGGVPASLNATLAAALIRLTRPQPDDRFLDPLCGAGTLLRERAWAAPYARLHGGDTSERALALARANLQEIHDVTLRRWDATRLPLDDGSIDKAALNPPYGRRSGSHAINGRLYPALFAELGRVLRPDGVVALVTTEQRLTVEALRRAGSFARERELAVDTGGLRTAVYLLRRR